MTDATSLSLLARDAVLDHICWLPDPALGIGMLVGLLVSIFPGYHPNPGADAHLHS
jgi:hypothetical protein